jgi:hypothetical protein
MAAAAAQHDAHEIGGILGAELIHDARPMHLDRARADAEFEARFLVGSALRDPPQHIVGKAARQQVILTIAVLPGADDLAHAGHDPGGIGFSMKSSAPLRMASTAVGMSPQPEMTRIGAG